MADLSDRPDRLLACSRLLYAPFCVLRAEEAERFIGLAHYGRVLIESGKRAEGVAAIHAAWRWHGWAFRFAEVQEVRS